MSTPETKLDIAVTKVKAWYTKQELYIGMAIGAVVCLIVVALLHKL